MLRGFIVTRHGAYLGVGTAATLLQAVNTRQREQNEQLAEQAAILSDTRAQAIARRPRQEPVSGHHEP